MDKAFKELTCICSCYMISVHKTNTRAQTQVLVSMQEHCDRLVAARLQADIMGTDTIIVARTDGEAASLLDNNVDARDHPYILGATNPNAKYVPPCYSFSYLIV
jgi:isocitrate lyase